MELQHIGKKRALMILTKRNSGYTFDSVYNLTEVGMSKNVVGKFVLNNLPYYCGIFKNDLT
jgi:hypothetical protein